jgi:hypothetical protein
MPLNNFSGSTFVAFVDISGFKFMMRENSAWEKLDSFYNSAYQILQFATRDQFNIQGLFFSDSGILFVDNNLNDESRVEFNKNIREKSAFSLLLDTIKQLNQKAIDNDYMLSTSISWGEFKYQNRLVFRRIEKNAVFGWAFVNAYQDSSIGRPKIRPGQCRIISELPDEIDNYIIDNELAPKIVKKFNSDRKHYYYYWMCNSANEVEQFEKDYNSSYYLQFNGYLNALKNAVKSAPNI